MRFSDVFKVQRVRVLPPKEGKKAQLQVEVATFGHTFTVYMAEDHRPKLEIGKEIVLEFALRAGQYGKPEVYLSNVG